MDRLLDGEDPLADDVINGLAGLEATLRQLQHACENTYARIIAARNDDRYGTEAASRQRLLDGLKHVYSNLTEEWPGRTAPVQTRIADYEPCGSKRWLCTAAPGCRTLMTTRASGQRDQTRRSAAHDGGAPRGALQRPSPLVFYDLARHRSTACGVDPDSAAMSLSDATRGDGSRVRATVRRPGRARVRPHVPGA